MKRWCFDNKNKKNNFLHTTHTIFFFIFSNHFFLFFFKILFFKHRNSFLLHASPWGNFYALSWFFYAHPHAYTPAFFAPHFKNTRFTPLLALFELSDNSEFSDNSHFSRTILNFQNILKCIFIHFQILPPANYQNIHNILKLNFCRGGVAPWKFQLSQRCTFVNPIIYEWRVI